MVYLESVGLRVLLCISQHHVQTEVCSLCVDVSTTLLRELNLIIIHRVFNMSVVIIIFAYSQFIFAVYFFI